MPLIKSSSQKAFKRNVGEMVKSGHPQKVALAAAYATQRAMKAKHMSKGGCSDCKMADGGKCMAHGGSVQSYEDMGGSAHEALLMEGRKAKYAEGGMVDAQRPLKTRPAKENPELDASMDEAEMAPHELVDSDMRGQEDSSMDEKDSPQVDEHISLSEAILKNRRRLRMAHGGKVADYEDDSDVPSPHDAPTSSYLDNDDDELDAPKEDGRNSRGLDLEPVHVMEDDEHDTSDASLVAQILKDRKKRRMGM